MALHKGDIIASTTETPPEVEEYYNEFGIWMQEPRPYRAVVRRAHKVADKFHELNKTQEASPCVKGCNYCCMLPVDVAQTEAAYIAEHYDIEPPNLIDGYMKHSENDYGNSLCPFNLKGECQIYEHRPMTCRTFFSQEDDKEACADLDGKGNYMALRSSENLLQLFNVIVTGTNIQGGADIRDFFGVEQIIIKSK